MIRAVVKNGMIQPVKPLPADWHEGHEVLVEDLEEEPPNGHDDIDTWSQEMKLLTAALDNPQEWQQIESALAEADRENKARVRREMGLP